MNVAAKGRAEACANIALSKYWGKSPRGDNLTAVPSLSLTLDALRTRTEVEFDDAFERDTLSVGGVAVEGRPLERVSEQLDRLRAVKGETRRARVSSMNNFPTAAGLASSASAFAALAVAADAALGLELSATRLSSEARRSSASAARSLYAGFVELEKEAESACPVFVSAHWDVVMLVAVVASGPKPVTSTGGMIHTRDTSPYYAQWEEAAPAVFSRVKQGVAEKNFRAVAEWMEHSTLAMHATMMTSVPPIVYLRGASVELIHRITEARAGGLEVAFTMDAGPNVKVLTTPSSADEAQRLLAEHPGVERVIVCRPGPGAARLALQGPLERAGRADGVDLGPFAANKAAK